MPWCPKCKSEYREGFTKCADCGSELISAEEFAQLSEQSPSSETSEDWMETAERETAEMERPEEQEAAEQEQERPEQNVRHVYSGGTVYQDSSERANENRSSAWVLMIVGCAGILGIILGMTGVIPFRSANSYLFYGVMAAVFILFLVAGIISMKNALVFEKKAESENSIRGVMLEWCREHLDAEELDRQIGADASETEEILYFKRFEQIKARLNYQFVNLDQDLLEKFIDDCVYDMIFRRNEDIA